MLQYNPEMISSLFDPLSGLHQSINIHQNFGVFKLWDQIGTLLLQESFRYRIMPNIDSPMTQEKIYFKPVKVEIADDVNKMHMICYAHLNARPSRTHLPTSLILVILN